MMLATVLLSGCAYHAKFTPVPDGSFSVSANTRGVTTYERAADGATKVKVDTAQVTLLDRIRAGLANVVTFISEKVKSTGLVAN